MLEVLERVNHELGTITVVITHNVATADMADRVIISSGETVDIHRNEKKVRPSGLTWRICYDGAQQETQRDLWRLRGQLLTIALVVAWNCYVPEEARKLLSFAERSSLLEPYGSLDAGT